MIDEETKISMPLSLTSILPHGNVGIIIDYMHIKSSQITTEKIP